MVQNNLYIKSYICKGKSYLPLALKVLKHCKNKTLLWCLSNKFINSWISSSDNGILSLSVSAPKFKNFSVNSLVLTFSSSNFKSISSLSINSKFSVISLTVKNVGLSSIKVNSSKPSSTIAIWLFGLYLPLIVAGSLKHFNLYFFGFACINFLLKL